MPTFNQLVRKGRKVSTKKSNGSKRIFVSNESIRRCISVFGKIL